MRPPGSCRPRHLSTLWLTAPGRWACSLAGPRLPEAERVGRDRRRDGQKGPRARRQRLQHQPCGAAPASERAQGDRPECTAPPLHVTTEDHAPGGVADLQAPLLCRSWAEPGCHAWMVRQPSLRRRTRGVSVAAARPAQRACSGRVGAPAMVDTKMASSVHACSDTPAGAGTRKRSARPTATDATSGPSLAPGQGAGAAAPSGSPDAATVALANATCACGNVQGVATAVLRLRACAARPSGSLDAASAWLPPPAPVAGRQTSWLAQ